MNERAKNIFMVVIGVIVIIALANLAWFIAGTLLKIIFSVLIFAVLAAIVLYLVAQARARR